MGTSVVLITILCILIDFSTTSNTTAPPSSLLLETPHQMTTKEAFLGLIKAVEKLLRNILDGKINWNDLDIELQANLEWLYSELIKPIGVRLGEMSTRLMEDVSNEFHEANEFINKKIKENKSPMDFIAGFVKFFFNMGD